jgi:hypothetical protein
MECMDVCALVCVCVCVCIMYVMSDCIKMNIYIYIYIYSHTHTPIYTLFVCVCVHRCVYMVENFIHTFFIWTSNKNDSYLKKKLCVSGRWILNSILGGSRDLWRMCLSDLVTCVTCANLTQHAVVCMEHGPLLHRVLTMYVCVCVYIYIYTHTYIYIRMVPCCTTIIYENGSMYGAWSLVTSWEGSSLHAAAHMYVCTLCVRYVYACVFFVIFSLTNLLFVLGLWM